MISVREQIMRAVVDALNATEKPADVPVCERVRALGATQPQLPLVVVYPLNESSERPGNGPIVRRYLTVRVHCKAAGTVSGDPVDALADAMLTWCQRALAGSRLGGLVHDISEAGTEWALEVADLAYLDATADYTISYQTLVNDGTRSV